MISRVILLASLVFELGSTTVSAEVPTDPEGFTKYVLNKFETAMPDHSFAYAGPLHIHDSKIGADTVGDEYLNGLFSLIVQKPESAETTVTRYVEKTAMLVADLKKADEKHVGTGDFDPPFPDLGRGDRGLIVYVNVRGWMRLRTRLEIHLPSPNNPNHATSYLFARSRLSCHGASTRG
jgi:hypothetical protein